MADWVLCHSSVDAIAPCRQPAHQYTLKPIDDLMVTEPSAENPGWRGSNTGGLAQGGIWVL